MWTVIAQSDLSCEDRINRGMFLSSDEENPFMFKFFVFKILLEWIKIH